MVRPIIDRPARLWIAGRWTSRRYTCHVHASPTDSPCHRRDPVRTDASLRATTIRHRARRRRRDCGCRVRRDGGRCGVRLPAATGTGGDGAVRDGGSAGESRRARRAPDPAGVRGASIFGDAGATPRRRQGWSPAPEAPLLVLDGGPGASTLEGLMRNWFSQHVLGAVAGGARPRVLRLSRDGAIGAGHDVPGTRCAGAVRTGDCRA